MTTKSEKSFVKRVIEFLKGGDEVKIEKFQKKVIKHLDNQIRLCNEEIDTQKEYLNEIEEKLQDAVKYRFI